MIDLKINGKPVQMIFSPCAYKQNDQIIVKLSEDWGDVKEEFISDDISIYAKKEGNVVGLIIKKFRDLEDFMSKP